MTHDIQTTQPGGPQQGEIILYQPDETVRLERLRVGGLCPGMVRLEDDTVWLTQQQMAELFLTTKQNVSLHVNNIFREDELQEASVVKESLTTAKDGKRYRMKLYNLDVIISVGYRVKSKRGTQFRQWANEVLKDYLLKGYAVKLQIRELSDKVDAKFLKYDSQLKNIQQKIDFFVRTSLPPVEGIFYDGQIFDAYAQVVGLIRQARRSITLIDNYIDETTLTMLSKRDAGKKLFAYIKMQETPATALMSGIR